MTLKQEILTALDQEPMTHASLYSYLEHNPSSIRKELHRLKTAGKIVRHSDYWTIPDSANLNLRFNWAQIGLFLVSLTLIAAAWALGYYHGGL